MSLTEAIKRLAAPFPPEEVQWKVQATSKDGTRALVVPYIDARAVMERLDEVVGPEGWQDSYEVDYARGLAKCRLVVLGVAKEDVGEAGEGGSIKAAVSDAFKRAAVKFGIARYLYRTPPVWVDYDPERKRLLEEPSLETGVEPAGEVALQALIREIRKLPGGEAVLRHALKGRTLSALSASEKRQLYRELRQAYRDLQTTS